MKRGIRQIRALPYSYGKYELLERIGTGGMAEVYRARLPGIGGFEKTVVIKRLRPKHAHDDTIAHLFIEEAKVAARVQHKNVVQVFELGKLEDGELYIAMEYVRGTDLRRLIEHAAQANRTIPAWLAVHITCEVLEALSCAHNLTDDGGRPRGLVHCDVTPDNIFLSRQGDTKLGDFGVATDGSRNQGLLAKGKLPYMSPEQVLEQPIDARTDVFSVSVVLWETLASRRLFPGRTPSEVMAQICASPRPPPSRFAPSVPKELDRLILEALEPDLEARFQTALDLARPLREILDHIHPRLSLDDVRCELTSLMDAPVVKPTASVFEPDEDDDGHDELEALDRMHDRANSEIRQNELAAEDSRAPEACLRQDPSKSAPSLPDADRAKTPSFDEVLPEDASTPWPSMVRERERDPRGLTPTKPRLPPPASTSVVPDGPTYRIIRDRRASSSGVDEIMQAYLADEDVEDELLSTAVPSASQAPPVLGGAAPLWVETEDDGRVGPLSLDEALNLLERAERRSQTRVALSLDRSRWTRAEEVARLLGEDLLRFQPPRRAVEKGSLQQSSFIEVVGGLARAQRTGQLTVWTFRGEDRELLELHLLGGALTHIRWTGAPFETWRSLFGDPLLGAQGLPEAFSLSVSTNTPILPRLPPSAADNVAATRHRHARRRFESAVAWTSGSFAFDPAGTVHVSNRGQPILKLLPGMTYCALSVDELERRLLTRLDRPHRLDPAFAGLRDELGLTEKEAKSLSALAGPEPLGVAARQAEHSADGKFLWVMAYVLTEIGLLSAA